MKTNCYKDVDLSYVPYRVKNIPKMDALVANYGNSITCFIFRKKIKEVEELLFIYNSERLRMAPFFYGVAKCARRMAEGDKNLKGIAVAMPDGEFHLSDLTNIRDRMLKLFNYFRSKAKGMIAGVIITGVLFILLLGGYVFTVIKQQKYNTVLCIFLLVALGAMFTVSWLGIIMTTFVRRLRSDLGEKWLQSFIDMSSRLQYVGQEDNRYFYNVQRGAFAPVDRAYRIIGVICKMNACEEFIDEEIP